jgi:hypothetical protein
MAKSIDARLARLEAYRRRRAPTNHLLTSVGVPWDLPPGMDADTWLQEEVTCACGHRGCPELRIGLVVPVKAPSAEAWSGRAQAYYAQRKALDA